MCVFCVCGEVMGAWDALFIAHMHNMMVCAALCAVYNAVCKLSAVIGHTQLAVFTASSL